MNILITGSAGFVGTHFLKYFSPDSSHTILGLDIKNNQDCRDFFKEDSHTVGYWDLVVHLAAIVGGRVTIESQPIAVGTDLSIDAEMFNWAVRKKPKKIIYYSSSAAYPTVLQTKELKHKLIENDIDLANPSRPDFTYGWAKLTGEMLANYATEKYGLDVSVFRPFSGYGEDQSIDYPFPAFIKRAKEKENPFIIWGDGTQVRDFIHIDDVVAATMAAVKQDIKGPLNIGWGRPTSFNELAEMVTKAAQYQPLFQHKKNKPTGVHFRVADTTKLQSFFQPEITLEEGILRALQV